MGKEIIAIAEALSNERAIPKDKIFEALESALATATKKNYPAEVNVRVAIDRKDGSYRTYRRWLVVDGEGALENPAMETSLVAARIEHPQIQAGEYIEEEIESVGFNRITIQIAKQVLSQKVKDAEREQMVAEHRNFLGRVINATVKKQGRDFMILDLGNNAEAVLKRDQLIPHETFGRGDRIKVLLSEIKQDNKGPQLICSRTSPEFLKELFAIEVPEIGEDVIEIMGAARDPGSRAKIAVRSKDKRIDPRGACIGMRGARVMAVSNELSGEKIDVVLWDENIAQYVTNAMEPAEISRIIINEDTRTIDVGVADDNLALAIGRNGQNVRLASQLLGWNLKVTTISEMENNLNAEMSRIIKLFVENLNIDEEFAAALADMGFTSLEEIAYVPIEEFTQIEGFDEETANILQENAKAAIKSREAEKMAQGYDELLRLEGMDELIAGALMAKGIKNAEELAEMATDEIVEMIEGLSEEKAGELIMSARNECWFKEPASDDEKDDQGAEAGK